MKVKDQIIKIFRYYSRDYIISGIAFILTYLSIFFIFSFSSILGHKALESFQNSFKDVDFIFASSNGIEFDKSGSLITAQSIDTSYVKLITKFLKDENISYQIINKLNTNYVSYILAFQTNNVSKLFSFCKNTSISIKSSYNKDNHTSFQNVIMYDVNGYRNRFNVFTFQDQITSFILNKEFSSTVGQLSRLIFIFSVIFTFYLSLLYFKERQSIYRVLLLQGFTDFSLKLIFIEYLILNLSAIILSIIPLIFVLWLNGIKISFAFWGLVYSLPYLPVILLLQVFLLFNRILNYLQDE